MRFPFSILPREGKFFFHTRSITLGVLINIFAILIFVMPGCSSADSDSNTEDDDKLAGSVEVDGSSTVYPCLLYTSPSPRDLSTSRMPSSA